MDEKLDELLELPLDSDERLLELDRRAEELDDPNELEDVPLELDKPLLLDPELPDEELLMGGGGLSDELLELELMLELELPLDSDEPELELDDWLDELEGTIGTHELALETLEDEDAVRMTAVRVAPLKCPASVIFPTASATFAGAFFLPRRCFI